MFGNDAEENAYTRGLIYNYWQKEKERNTNVDK